MSDKSYLASIEGFTPAPTILSRNRKYGAYGALVWGVIWRYTQLKNGECFASLETLAKEIGVSIPTFIKYRDRLIEDGYFEDLTPKKQNSAHILIDTYKLFIKTETKMIEQGVKDVNTKSDIGVKDVNSRYKRALHKDSNKDSIKKNCAVSKPKPLADFISISDINMEAYLLTGWNANQVPAAADATEEPHYVDAGDEFGEISDRPLSMKREWSMTLRGVFRKCTKLTIPKGAELTKRWSNPLRDYLSAVVQARLIAARPNEPHEHKVNRDAVMTGDFILTKELIVIAIEKYKDRGDDQILASPQSISAEFNNTLRLFIEHGANMASIKKLRGSTTKGRRQEDVTIEKPPEFAEPISNDRMEEIRASFKQKHGG